MRAGRKGVEALLKRACLFSLLIILLPAWAAAGEIDEADQVLSCYRNGDLDEGDRFLESFLRNFPESERRCELLLAAAAVPRPLFDSIRRLRRVISDCGTCSATAAAMARLARLYHLSGQDRSAYNTCRDFLSEYPEHELAPEVLLLQGSVEMNYEGGRLAGNSYAIFLAKYPDHPQANSALIGVADAKVKQGDWVGAHQAYLRASDADNTSLEMCKVLFYLGYSSEMIGDRQRARHYYQELIRLYADSPYSQRARQRMDTVLAVGGRGMSPPADLAAARFAVQVGRYRTFNLAKKAAGQYLAAGYKVHYLMRGEGCLLLVGEFDAEVDARLFARELAERYQVSAVPMLLP